MRKLFFLPLLTLALACNDNTPVGPELALSPEMAVAQAKGGMGDVLKMVPFKGKGDFWVIAHPSGGCEGSMSNLPAAVGGAAEVTHLGGSQLTFVNCWEPWAENPLGNPFPYDFVSQSGTFTAANGDELSWYGSAPGATIAFLTATTYRMGPMAFVGGTGRFAGAEGHFFLNGFVADDFLSGTLEFDGAISSVGSSK